MAVETAPSTSAGITTTIDESGIATLLIDQPGQKVNVMNMAFVEELERAVGQLASAVVGAAATGGPPSSIAESPALKGVILTSGKKGQFVAGADLEQLLQATRPEEPTELVRRLHRALNRLESLPCPSVAAINGPALGGGLELALACDYRVCVGVEGDLSRPSGNILGSPEVQLGLLPAGGACQRLPRLVGLSRALELILEGKRYSPRRARKYGVIDEVVHPAVLMEAARAWLARGKRRTHPRWSRLDEAAVRWPLVRSLIYRQAERTVARKTKGHYPAPLKALDAVRAGQEQGFGAGLAAEAVAFGELATGDVARNLIRLFFATEGLKKEQRATAPAGAAPVGAAAVGAAPSGGPSGPSLVTRGTHEGMPGVRRTPLLGVVGAGFMGAGIAQASAVAGYAVRLRDLTPEQVAHGIKTARNLTLSAARTSRLSRTEAQDTISRLSGTTDFSGFKRAQLVIEAVFEDVDVKRRVIAELEEALAPQAVIASNTSSLPIASLAASARHPERIVGMHFFSPVHKMPLLEVVRAKQSSEQAVSTAIEAGRAMGKTVIVVRDGPGFYTTRVLGFMVQEAGRLFEEGGSIESIDRAMTAFGFPVGPLALSDEVGLDIAAHISDVLGQSFSDRFAASGSIHRLVQAGRLGRKSKSGFYDYSGRRKKPDASIYALRDAAPQHFPADLIQRRLVLMFVNEAARCLEEGIIASPRDGDVGAIMGVGFPPFLGGPFRYADQLGATGHPRGMPPGHPQGVPLVDQLQQLQYAYGPAFAPASILEQMARDGDRFYHD